jgi:predicted nucleic acid-binding Zn ribbon protein
LVEVSDESKLVFRGNPDLSNPMNHMLDAIGYLDHCTMIHVGGGIAITSGHCLGAEPVRHTGVCGTPIMWGYRQEQSSSFQSRCVEVLAMEKNEKRDYAVIRVDPVPPVAARVASGSRPKTGTGIAVFGHAYSGPLTWSGPCQIDVTPQVDQISASYLFDHCDTMLGMSGGPVLDLETGQIVGIHKGGKKDVAGNLVSFATYVVETPLMDYLRQR